MRCHTIRPMSRSTYEISESSGWFNACKVDVHLLLNTRTDIGKARTFEHALDLIKSHSGKGIDKVG